MILHVYPLDIRRNDLRIVEHHCYSSLRLLPWSKWCVQWLLGRRAWGKRVRGRKEGSLRHV